MSFDLFDILMLAPPFSDEEGDQTPTQTQGLEYRTPEGLMHYRVAEEDV